MLLSNESHLDQCNVDTKAEIMNKVWYVGGRLWIQGHAVVSVIKEGGIQLWRPAS